MDSIREKDIPFAVVCLKGLNEKMIGQTNLPVLLIQLCLLDPFVLGAPVLEPDLDLRLSEPQGRRKFEPATPRDVLSTPVLDFQPQGLLAAKGCPLPSRSTLFPSSARHCDETRQMHFSARTRVTRDTTS